MACAHDLIRCSVLSREATLLTRHCQNQERQLKSFQDALARALEENLAKVDSLWEKERAYGERLARLAFLRDRLNQLQGMVGPISCCWTR